MGNAREIPLTSAQKSAYSKVFGLSLKGKREVHAAIFQDEVTKFMEAHKITVAEMYAAIGNCEKIPFTFKNVEKVCKALSKLSGAEFETSFNNLKS